MNEEQLYKIGLEKKAGNIDKTWDQLADEYGFSTGEAYRGWVKREQKKRGELIPQLDVEEIDDEKGYKESFEYNKDGTYKSDKLLRMSEEQKKDIKYIMNAHGFDPNVWELISCRNNIWNVYSKQDGVQQLYSSKIVVKPLAEYKWNEEDIEKLFKNLKTDYQNKKFIYNKQYEQNGNILVVPIADLHYNLLSDKKITGNDYNPKIAEERYYHTLFDIENRISNRKFEKVLFIVGNDFINADNLNGTTTRGTPQDNAAFWFTIVEKAAQLLINGIDLLSEIAPVDVVYVPSNHDLHTVFGIMQTIKAWYRDPKYNVSVDCSPLPRKYYKFGNNLLALSHDIKVKDALQIVTSEAKEYWTGCKHIVCLLAHLHQAMIYDKQGYLEIMRLPTISGWSRWTNQEGYIQSEPKNKAFIINKELGITDEFNTVIL
jgi:hypothetical protein